MPTKPLAPASQDQHHHYWSVQHYTELARISTGLFVGLLALMTFLLTAGLQHPQKMFSYALYFAIISLPLGLIAFTIGHSLHQLLVAKSMGLVDKPASKKDEVPTDPLPTLRTSLKVVRLLQQIIFVVSIVAVTTLAVVSANIFFAPVPSSSQAPVQAQ